MAFSEILAESPESREVLNFSDLFSVDNREQIVISDNGYILCDVATGQVIEQLAGTINGAKKKLKKLGKAQNHPVFMNLQTPIVLSR